MKRIWTTIAWLTAMTMARAADFATTYHFSPDLSQERNPLVYEFGGHWFSIVFINVMVCGAIFVCAFLYCRSKPRCDLIRESSSTWDFASLLLYGSKLQRSEFLRRRMFSIKIPPKGFRAPLVHLCGFCFPPVITGVSLLAVFAWFATRQWRLQWFINTHNHLGILLFLIAIVVMWSLAESIFFSSEYKRAQRFYGTPHII